MPQNAGNGTLSFIVVL